MNNVFSATTDAQSEGRANGIRLFRVFGITVFLHWSWFIVAFYLVQSNRNEYSSIAWSVGQCIALFGIVLLHEFGHALACRSVGGQANRIILWPLGGVAFINPPPRPGAVLWSIGAGPLVNVALIPATYFLKTSSVDWGGDRHIFCTVIFNINLGLLIFNMLPIYPLDGGQILQSLLWFVMGRARSLLVAASIGIVGAIGGVICVYELIGWDTWLTIMAIFAVTMAWNGIQTARRMLQYERAVAQQQAMGWNMTYKP